MLTKGTYVNKIRAFLKKSYLVRKTYNMALSAIYAVKDIPLSETVVIQTSNICNAKCIFCAYRYYTDDKKIMSDDLFIELLNKIDTSKVKLINFTSCAGEPLTDPTFHSKVAYAKSKGFNVMVSTNGGLLNYDEKYKKILESGIDSIQISTPGINKEAYERVFGFKNYEVILEGFINLLKYKKENNINTTIAFSARRDREIHELLNDTDYKKYIKPFVNEKEGGVIFDVEGYVKFDSWCGLIKQQDLTGIMSLHQINHDADYFCSRLINNITILVDGQVRLCACRHFHTQYDELVVGDLKTTDLYHCINSKKRKNLFKNSFWGRFPLVCNNCSYNSFNADS